MITLGQSYTDSITGFKGIATSRTVYLNGCVHVALQPKVGEKGEMPKTEYFDEAQLEPKDNASPQKHPGGPASHSPGMRHEV